MRALSIRTSTTSNAGSCCGALAQRQTSMRGIYVPTHSCGRSCGKHGRQRLHATTQKSNEEPSVEMEGPPGPSAIPPELSMFVVAAMWGSNPACLRYAYMLDSPPSPATLGAIQSLAGAVLLSIVAAFSPQSKEPRPHNHSNDTGIMQALDDKLDNVWKAGAETGLWTFVANVATISGFQQTPASRGAFLIRLTVAFTPVVAKLTGLAVSNKEWAAAAVGVLGGILISLDSTLRSGADDSLSPVGTGDALLVIAALLWAFQTVRIGRHALRFDEIPLARNQIATMAVLSTIWLAISFGSDPGSNPTGNLFAASTSPLVLLAAFWPGVGPWGIATALQVKAQSTLSASKTQIILATDAIWAAGFATLLGSPDEGFGSLGYAGAACLVLASAASATS